MVNPNDKPISQFITLDALTPEAFFPIVDPTEPVPADRNKKIFRDKILEYIFTQLTTAEGIPEHDPDKEYQFGISPIFIRHTIDGKLRIWALKDTPATNEPAVRLAPSYAPNSQWQDVGLDIGVSSAFDIAALPDLPQPIQNTDLFAVNRAGVHYKVSGAQIKTFVGSTTEEPENTAPSITLVADDNVVTTADSPTLLATPTDADGTIVKVEFYEGTELLTTVNNAPWNLIIQNPAAGSHSYTAKAYDNNNAATTSNAVTITVTAVNVSPDALNATAQAETEEDIVITIIE